MLSPLLYSLFTHNCVAKHDSNNIIKFADDKTVVGLITDNDETAYWEEARDLSVWCQDNNLSLNVSKTKELNVDYRKRRAKQAPINIKRAVVEQVENFKFLGGPTTPFPPQATEKIGRDSPDPQKVLQLHHREHPEPLHHNLIWQLLSI